MIGHNSLEGCKLILLCLVPAHIMELVHSLMPRVCACAPRLVHWQLPAAIRHDIRRPKAAHAVCVSQRSARSRHALELGPGGIVSWGVVDFGFALT